MKTIATQAAILSAVLVLVPFVVVIGCVADTARLVRWTRAKIRRP